MVEPVLGIVIISINDIGDADGQGCDDGSHDACKDLPEFLLKDESECSLPVCSEVFLDVFPGNTQGGNWHIEVKSEHI